MSRRKGFRIRERVFHGSPTGDLKAYDEKIRNASDLDQLIVSLRDETRWGNIAQIRKIPAAALGWQIMANQFPNKATLSEYVQFSAATGAGASIPLVLINAYVEALNNQSLSGIVRRALELLLSVLVADGLWQLAADAGERSSHPMYAHVGTFMLETLVFHVVQTLISMGFDKLVPDTKNEGYRPTIGFSLTTVFPAYYSFQYLSGWITSLMGNRSGANLAGAYFGVLISSIGASALQYAETEYTVRQLKREFGQPEPISMDVLPDSKALPLLDDYSGDSDHDPENQTPVTSSPTTKTGYWDWICCCFSRGRKKPTATVSEVGDAHEDGASPS